MAFGYGILRRDQKLIDQDWDLVVLDEAQAIKKPNTQQTKAVKKLNSKMKIAMTGTQIDIDQLIQESIQSKLTEFDDIMDVASKKSQRIINSGDLEAIFGDNL